jgi:transposase-like protein
MGKPDAVSAEDIQRAEEMYVRSGRNTVEIAREFGNSVKTVEAWCRHGEWVRKRKAWMTTPRTAAVTLRENLHKRMEAVCASGTILEEEAKEVERISKLVDRMEREGYQFNAAAIEVIWAFTAWVRQQAITDEEYMVVSSWLEAWLRRIMT